MVRFVAVTKCPRTWRRMSGQEEVNKSKNSCFEEVRKRSRITPEHCDFRRMTRSPKSLSAVRTTRVSCAARSSTFASDDPRAMSRTERTSWPWSRSQSASSGETFSSARIFNGPLHGGRWFHPWPDKQPHTPGPPEDARASGRGRRPGDPGQASHPPSARESVPP